MSVSVHVILTPMSSSTIEMTCGTASANGGAVGFRATVKVYTVPRGSTRHQDN
jgi:hypothetical protein